MQAKRLLDGLFLVAGIGLRVDLLGTTGIIVAGKIKTLTAKNAMKVRINIFENAN